MTAPVEPVWSVFENIVAPFKTSCTTTVALFAGVACVDGAPSGVCSTVTVNEPPLDRVGGIVAFGVNTTACASAFGFAMLPAWNPWVLLHHHECW